MIEPTADQTQGRALKELRENRGERLNQTLRNAQGKGLLLESWENSSRQEELKFKEEKRICTRCNKREVYLKIKTVDWCEPCIWEFVQN